MGRSIDLYSYDYGKLTNRILEVCKTNNKELIEKVLLSCGTKIADRYIILNQEFWENSSCYYNVATTLETIFNVDDVFGEIFCVYGEDQTDKQELINAMEMYEIEEKIGMEIPEREVD